MASSSEKRKSAYDAFNAVDKLVAKPVVGSDGAASWQQFRKNNKQYTSKLGSSVAPTAPLKAVDRATGMKTWQEERLNEAKIRESSGDASLNAGYTTFQNKNAAEEAAARKKRKLIEARVRPDDKEYFVPTKSFQGWKFDYVFTTKDRGTGYYWDGMDSVKRLRGELKEIPPTSTQADDEINESCDKVTSTEGTTKKKKRKKEGPVIVDDPSNPMEQVAVVLQQRNYQSETLPVGWEAAKDPTSGKVYYYNRTSGERQWDKPEVKEATLPEGWSIAKDPTTGKEYYYHEKTKETRWERPVV